MNIFYVYALCDPMKPGPYRYGRWVFLHEPFYVGKGKGKRAYEHAGISYVGYNLHKDNKIAKIKRMTGAYPLVEFKRQGLDESAAHALEVKLIALIGRASAKLGPLVNQTDGGDGVSGYVYSPEWRANNGITRRTSHAAFAAEVAKVNPGLVLLDTYVSQKKTPKLRVELPCGCERELALRTLLRAKAGRCRFCSVFERAIAHNLILHSLDGDVAKFECIDDATHVYTQRVDYLLSDRRFSGCIKCNQQHPYKLTAAQIAQIKMDTRSSTQISVEYACSPQTVLNIKGGFRAYEGLGNQ